MNSSLIFAMNFNKEMAVWLKERRKSDGYCSPANAEAK